MEKLEEGQEVVVFTHASIRKSNNRPRPGIILKVGRKLVTIEYGEPGSDWKPTAQFRIETGMINDDYGRLYFLTLDQAEEQQRREAALAILREHKVQLGMHGTAHGFTTAQIEQLAAVVEGWK